VKITNVDFLSFREYLYLKHQIELPELSFEEILNNHQKLFLEQYDKEGYFREYLRNNITFMLEDNSTQLLKQIANKIIERDLFYYGDFNSDDIENLKNTIRFIANVPISDINYSSISSNIGVTKYKAKLYLDYLQKGYLLQSIMPYSSSVIKEPKVVLNIPFREYLSDRLPESQLYGAIREESFVQMISKIPSLQLFYLKSQRGARTPDYLVIYKGKKIIFEVGGKGKSFKQFKGIDKEFDRYTVNYPGITSENKIPLLLFGFME
jgi:hypothetical protein